MDRLHYRTIYLLVLGVIFTLFLTSCTHVSRNDGPPSFYVDERRIPNAVPKVEPPAKFGNMASYRVFGKRYHVMASSRNYEQIGTASWYGTKFHSRRTSSGEHYNMLGMTAAHKTLPLPTYVEVTNLKNHRQIIVKVNDRGPFESNRLIDLSFVAAKKLGMIGHGTALVKVKAIDPRTYGQPLHFAADSRKEQPILQDGFLKNQASPEPLVYLQVGAFHDRNRAEKLKNHLHYALATPVKVYKGNLYRVKVGPIRDVKIAAKISSRLRKMGLKPASIYGV